MSYNIFNIGWIEILKNGDNHNTTSNRSYIDYTPIDIVSTNKSNLITLLQAHTVEQNMQTSNLLSRFKVGFGLLAEIIRKYWQGVILAETRLVHFN